MSMKTTQIISFKYIITGLLCILTYSLFGMDLHLSFDSIHRNKETSRTTAAKDSLRTDTVGDHPSHKYVEISVFTVKIENGEVKIHWETVNQTNNDFFTVERSINVTDWETVTTLDAPGTVETLLSYDYIDKNPLGGISYYRLRSTDFNGAETYSLIRAIEMKDGISETIMTPQPAGSFVKIMFAEPQHGEVSFLILSPGGNPVARYNSHSQETTLDISFLPQGVYFIFVQTVDRAEMLKMVKN